MIDEVILVDSGDMEIGSEEKLLAHEKGLLHRAFSVLLFNSQGDFLLQRRADSKYHSAGLWSNACCSHPRPSENTKDAVRRRLKEELGISCSCDFHSKFIYKTAFENGLTEHEFDHVYVGISDTQPELNPLEASEYRYVSTKELKDEIERNPDSFTYWFKQILAQNEYSFT